jgi:hypothetical protein
MPNITLGVFTDRQDAESALNELMNAGFNPKDISIIVRDQTVRTEVLNSTSEEVVKGTTSGATTGGAVGALAGLLIGLGVLTIPGIGGLLIGGPIAAALGLTGAAATTVSGGMTGALAGGLVGALAGLGVPKQEAQVYEDLIREGAILLAVPSGTQENRVTSILESHGAEQIRTVNS